MMRHQPVGNGLRAVPLGGIEQTRTQRVAVNVGVAKDNSMEGRTSRPGAHSKNASFRKPERHGVRSLQAGRAGATLTEVLMSLLIMSIGVVSVISLFPISIIRAIQATQLTNGKFCEQNAEQIVTTYPTILQGAFPRPAQPNVGVAGVYSWQSNTMYTAAPPGSTSYQVVVPTTALGSHQPASTKRFICRDVSLSGNDFTTGSIEPDWNHPVLDSTNDYDGDGLFNDYVVYDGPDIVWQVDTRARVIDPHGAMLIDGGLLGGYWNEFGNVNFVAPGDAIPRIDPTAGSIAQADALFALPDSWVLDVEAIPFAMLPADSASTTPGTVTMPPGGELPFNPATLPFGSMRITFVNLNGTEVASRLVNTAASTFLDIVFQWPDLPLSFDANGDSIVDLDDIGSVRIEHFEPRYTWLYSVSAADPNEQPRVSCVVFFNRAFSVDDEFLYNANFGNLAGADVDEDGNADGDVDGDGTVEYTGTNQARVWYGTDPEPTIKPGGYIFDGRAGHWYQIQSINRVEETIFPRTAVLTLSEPVYVPTPAVAAVSAGTQGRAMLMKGIIQVFDLEL